MFVLKRENHTGQDHPSIHTCSRLQGGKKSANLHGLERGWLRRFCFPSGFNLELEMHK